MFEQHSFRSFTRAIHARSVVYLSCVVNDENSTISQIVQCSMRLGDKLTFLADRRHLAGKIGIEKAYDNYRLKQPQIAAFGNITSKGDEEKGRPGLLFWLSL